MIAMRYGQNDLAPLTNAALPSPDELPMRYAVAAVRVLQWQNQGTLAVDYAYRVLRANTSEIEAHKAYLGSLTAGARPDIPAAMDEVGVGSAVEYSENSDAPAGWFVIEDTDKPSKEFEEIAASDDRAKELLGKKVGDTFVLVNSPLKNRVGKITQILMKSVPPAFLSGSSAMERVSCLTRRHAVALASLPHAHPAASSPGERSNPDLSTFQGRTSRRQNARSLRARECSQLRHRPVAFVQTCN